MSGGGGRAQFAGPRGRLVQGAISAEVLVIGGGIAGAAAALAARRKGRQVALVRRSWGATALSCGLLDLAPDPLAAAGQPLGERREVAGCIRVLARRRPTHPWGVLRDRLWELERVLAAAAAESGGRITFTALDTENRCLFTSLGTLKASAGGLDGILAGDLLPGGRVGLVGFGLHPAYDAGLQAAALDELAAAAGLDCRALPVACDYLDRFDEYDLRPVQIARRIEDHPPRLLQSIRRALPAAVERLLLPPVLGVDDPGELLALLERELGLPCAELPATSAAPLPGLRLQRLLEDRLEAAGVELWLGEAVAPDGTVASLQISSPAPSVPDERLFDEGRVPIDGGGPEIYPVEARKVVLATGRYVGGGIERRGRLREAVFELPVVAGAAVDEGRWIGALTDTANAGEHAAFLAGVAVDEKLRVLREDGPDHRLHACGSVLAGNDPARDGAGLGLSWCTGWLAGEAAAEEGS